MRHAKHERTEFYFHHTFSSNHNHDMRKTRAVNRRNLTQQQADFHPLQLDAKLGIHQKYKYKLPKHFATPKSCRIEKAVPFNLRSLLRKGRQLKR